MFLIEITSCNKTTRSVIAKGVGNITIIQTILLVSIFHLLYSLLLHIFKLVVIKTKFIKSFDYNLHSDIYKFEI